MIRLAWQKKVQTSRSTRSLCQVYVHKVVFEAYMCSCLLVIGIEARKSRRTV